MKKVTIMLLAAMLAATTPITTNAAFKVHKTEITTTTAAPSLSVAPTVADQSTSNAAPGKDKEEKSKTRNKIVAILLWFFLGAIGIHRFYLGYTTIGIIQLLTGCGFGIWWLIDGFRLLTGSLRPRKGLKWSDKV